MSNELADRFADAGIDMSASDETRERFNELMNRNRTHIISNPTTRLDAALRNEFVPAEVDSWDGLWRHYSSR